MNRHFSVKRHPAQGRTFLSAAVLFVTMAPLVRANGISAVMGWSTLHLYFGNVLIGVIEGLIAAWVFRISKKRAIGIMILANYFSAIATLVFFALYSPPFDPGSFMARVYAIPPLVYLSTLILEWPFCLWIFSRVEKRLKKSVLAVLLINAITYVPLIYAYYQVSDCSLYRLAKHDPSLVKSCSLRATVYYLDPQQGALCRIGINGTNPARIPAILPPEVRGLRGLFAEPSLRNDRQWELWLLAWKQGRGVYCEKLLDFAPGTRVSDWKHRYYPPMDDQAYDYETRSASLLSPGEAPRWKVEAWRSHWGLVVGNLATGQSMNLNLDVPFMIAHSSAPTLLPDGLVVYQLDRRIMLLDLKTMRFDVITTGIYPIVAIDDNDRASVR